MLFTGQHEFYTVLNNQDKAGSILYCVSVADAQLLLDILHDIAYNR